MCVKPQNCTCRRILLPFLLQKWVPLSWPLIRMKISNFLQAPFTHLLAHLLGGHPRVGASTFQAGGLGQSLRSPPPPPGTGAPKQYKPPGSILWISSAGAHVHCGLSYSPGPSCSAQVPPCELRWCCAFLTSYGTFQAQRVLILTSLGKQLLNHYLAFLWVFSSSEPADFLSSIPSLLCFQCVGPAEAPIGDTQRRNQHQVLAADPSAHLTCISVSYVLRENSAGKEFGELE